MQFTKINEESLRKLGRPIFTSMVISARVDGAMITKCPRFKKNQMRIMKKIFLKL